MARYFIVGAKGESERWLVDTHKREVQPIDVDEVSGDEHEPIVRGITLAIAAENRSGLVSHQVAPST